MHRNVKIKYSDVCKRKLNAKIFRDEDQGHGHRFCGLEDTCQGQGLTKLTARLDAVQTLTFVECFIIFSRFDDVVLLSFFIHTLPTISDGLTARYMSNSSSVN